MRNLKKVLSLVLCVAMMLSVMVVGAGAAFSDQSKIKNTEAVDMCTALNIIGGYPDGTFKPEGNITRAEVTKMICVALNGGKEPNVGTNATPTFSDVRTNANSAWAEGYIESCYAQGIVSGVGGGKFAPAGNVTATQMAKMLLVALGYNADNEGFTGNAWATNVNVRASQKGLYEGLESIDVSAPLTRDNAAQMIWNALKAYEVEYKTTLTTDKNGQLVSQITVQDKVVGSNNDKITLLKDKYEVYDNETAVMTGFSYDDSKDEWTYTFSNDYTNASGNVVTGNLNVKNLQVTCAEDYTDLFLQNVKVIYTQKGTLTNNRDVDKVFGMYADGSSVVASGVLNDIDLLSDTAKVKVDGTEYKLTQNTSNVSIYKFNEYGTTAVDTLNDIDTVLSNTAKAKAYSFKLIDNSDDNKGDVIVIYPFTVAQIDYLSSSSITLTNNIGNKDLDDVNLYKDAAEDDWTVVTAAANAKDQTMTIAKAEIVSGEVTAIKGTAQNPTSVKVNGTWYDVAELPTDSDKPSVNNEYDLTVVNGYVFYADKTKGNVSTDNVLYMDKYAALTSGLSDGIEAKVYFTDGSSKTVTLTNITPAVNSVEVQGEGKTSYRYLAGEDYDIVADVKTDGNLDYTKKDNDEIFASEATAMLNGYSLYTYSVKDGDYSVEPVSANNVGSYDEYITAGSATLKDGKLPATIKDSTSNARFDDNAVIFVKDADGVKVVSGKTVNNWKDINITGFAGLADKSSGNYYTAIGAIKMTFTARSDASEYGFVTSDISSSKENGTWYSNFTIWNGTESIDVKVENAPDNLAKYSFVKFDWSDEAAKKADKEGFMVVNLKSGSTSTADKRNGSTSSQGAVAIESFVTDDSIKFSNKQTELDFADTYFVIGVDTKNGEGANVTKLSTAKDCQKEGHTGDLYANAVYFTVKDGNDDVVEAVFIDVNGMMYSDKNGDQLCTHE